MAPVDPRLVRSVRPVRVHLAVTVACGVATTAAILLQAWLIARIVAGASAPISTGATAGATDLGVAIAAVAAVALARTALAYGAETAALRSAAEVKSQLRRRLVAHVTRPTADPTATDAGAVVTLATRGLDALDDYIARYLPQLVLAVIAPVAVLVVVASADWLSAVVIGLTLPLIPLFMALVGWHTQARTQRQWRLLERLGGHFLDVVEGLPTLAIFRRAKAEAAHIREATDEHRKATMGTLKVAFLSAFVLELLATLAVAVVAVEVGLRLLYGGLSLETALLVLILAPEAYLPLREVGARFHASQEGVAVIERVLETLGPDAPPEPPAGAAPPALDTASAGGSTSAGDGIRFAGVTLTYPGGPTALAGLDLDLPPGRTLLVTGRSGAGKTSVLSLLLRFVAPTDGRITAGGVDLAGVDPDAWRRRIAWVPQHPYLFDDTAAANIRLGAPDASDEAVRRAAELAEVHDVITALPDGYATRLGERGARLSAGQRQRIALARAFLRVETDAEATLVLLDEPTAHLDAANAALVRTAVERLLRGRTGVIVAHDTGWTDLADDVLTLHAPAELPTAVAR